MTRDDIVRMALEAGFAKGVAELLGLKKFARFAALVAAAEREACAKVIDAKIEEVRLFTNELHLLQCAAAIRRRSLIDSIVQNERSARGQE